MQIGASTIMKMDSEYQRQFYIANDTRGTPSCYLGASTSKKSTCIKQEILIKYQFISLRQPYVVLAHSSGLHSLLITSYSAFKQQRMSPYQAM